MFFRNQFCYYITIISLIILLISNSSCSSTKSFHNMNYFADSVTEASQVIGENSKVVLQPGDRLSILVTALNPIAAQPFNIGGGGTGSVTEAISGGESVLQTGYLIADDGFIQFPQLGRINVKGFTTQHLEKLIQKALLQFLTDPIVRVNIINFKVNVLGEVNKPGTINVQDGITILEAISRSGDLTINGIRENILVVREKDGRREFGKINLASKNIFSSPYFYLQPGDIVYVSMNKNKVLLSDANQQRKLSLISIIFATISTAALVFNAVKK